MDNRNPDSDNILYWKDVIASPEILEKYKTLIEKLRTGDYRGADLDLKLKRPKIWGIKVNEKERLLFITIKVDGQPYAFITEELLDHKYENSQSMNGDVESILYTNKSQKIIEEFFARQNENNAVI